MAKVSSTVWSTGAYFLGRGLINMFRNRIFWTLAAASASSLIALDVFRAQLPSIGQALWGAGWVIVVGLVIGMIQAKRLDRKGQAALKNLAHSDTVKQAQINHNVKACRAHLANVRGHTVGWKSIVSIVGVGAALGMLEHFGIPGAAQIMNYAVPVALIAWAVLETCYFWPKISTHTQSLTSTLLVTSSMNTDAGKKAPTLGNANNGHTITVSGTKLEWNGTDLAEAAATTSRPASPAAARKAPPPPAVKGRPNDRAQKDVVDLHADPANNTGGKSCSRS